MYKPNSSGHKRLQQYQRYQSREKKQKTFSGDNIFNEQSAYVETEECYTQNIAIEESMFSENEKFSGNSTEESVLFKSVGIQCDLSMEELLKEENQKLVMELRDRNMEVYLLRQENEELKKRDLIFSIEKIKENNAHLNFFTGLPNMATFVWILSLLTRTNDVKLCSSRLSKKNHLLVILIKLQLGLLNKDIAFHFSVCESVISRILRNWLPALAICLQPLIK